MKYRIVCAKPGKLEEVATYLYDNQTNEVFDAEGCLVDFRKDERFADFPTMKPSDRAVKDFSQDEPIIGKSRRVKTLKIQLGMACNYHCKYCLQNAYRDGGIRLANAHTVEAFFQTLDEQSIELASDGQIELWGGEPLVYWKTLKILLPKIRSRWGDDISIQMTTNGSLMTREKVDFLIDHRVTVTISHDGPGFDLRDDVDPLTEPETKDAWLYLLEKSRAVGIRMGFCVVISPKNVNLFDVKDFFATQFSPEARFYFEGVVTNDGAANDACCLTPEEARTLDSAVFKALIQEEGQWESLEWRALGLMRHLINRVPADRIEGRCDTMTPEVMVVDLYGRVGTCQNRPTKQFQIGRIANLRAVTNPYFTRWTRRPVCGKCLVLSACKGSCPHLTDESLALCCPNEFVFHAAIFGAVWFRLTGTIMMSALPVVEPS